MTKSKSRADNFIQSFLFWSAYKLASVTVFTNKTHKAQHDIQENALARYLERNQRENRFSVSKGRGRFSIT